MKTKKTIKEESAPEVIKKVKVVKEKTTKPQVKMISFSVTAVIPTQQYGNIQPTITVSAPTIEDARALVMPVIENFYETYAELPLNGRQVKFLSKITESEKKVDMKLTPAPVMPEPAQTVPIAPVVTPETPKSALEPTSAPVSLNTQTAGIELSEPFKKAEKAISLASSHEALQAIQTQIENSVKINPADKPTLLQMVLTRKNNLPF